MIFRPSEVFMRLFTFCLYAFRGFEVASKVRSAGIILRWIIHDVEISKWAKVISFVKDRALPNFLLPKNLFMSQRSNPSFFIWFTVAIIFPWDSREGCEYWVMLCLNDRKKIINSFACSMKISCFKSVDACLENILECIFFVTNTFINHFYILMIFQQWGSTRLILES